MKIFIMNHDKSERKTEQESFYWVNIDRDRVWYFKEKYHNQLANIAKVAEENDIKIVLIKEPYYLDLKLQNEINKLSRGVLLEKLTKYRKEDY